jgi:hypothetical protein
MEFRLMAKNSGKNIRVFDRITKKDAFNDFLDPGKTVSVTVGTNDGETGNIDIYKSLRGAPNTVDRNDYDVKRDELVEVDD